MNKFMLLLLISLFVYVYAEGESSSSEEQSWAAIIDNKLNSSLISDAIVLSEKTKKQCPDIEDKLSSTIEEIATCIDNIELGENTFCSLVRKNFGKCAEPVKKLLMRCLPDESKALPVIAIKIAAAVIDQACNSTVEEILELFNPCMIERNFTSYESCTKVKNSIIEHRNKFPSKSLVCSMIPSLTSCVRSHREASCKNPITKEALINFYEAIESATTTDCQEINKVA